MADDNYDDDIFDDIYDADDNAPALTNEPQAAFELQYQHHETDSAPAIQDTTSNSVPIPESYQPSQTDIVVTTEEHQPYDQDTNMQVASGANGNGNWNDGQSNGQPSGYNQDHDDLPPIGIKEDG
ncbi:hypothetical protein LTR66_013521, partial [Elasticomyces elasticus]